MKEGLKDIRKQMFAQMEQKLHESWPSEEDSLFYYHSSEDRIVLSHERRTGGRVPVSRKNYLDEEIDETVNNVLF